MNSKLEKENFIFSVAKTTNKVKLKIYEGEVYGNVGNLLETAPEAATTYSPSLDFSNSNNSQYIPII
jgi:hypothetical protein